MAKNSEKQRINLLGPYLTKTFGEKTAKLSLDGGFTCPNRDGTVGFGGCSFCSERGSGDNASHIKTARDISQAIDSQISLLSGKWKTSSYIAYFQNFTSTYAPIEKLEELYYAALNDPRIRGLAIATRPDCLSDDVLGLLSKINESHYLWVELGLQTCNDRVAESFGRGYPTCVYDEAARNLTARNIRFVTHLLLGLPGEAQEDIKKSLRHVLRENMPWGLKFHLLNIIKGTRMATEHPDYCLFDSPEEYASFVCDLLEMVPKEIVIHRLSADSPAELLIAPKWAYRKRVLLDMIFAEMERRDSFQGINYLG